MKMKLIKLGTPPTQGIKKSNKYSALSIENEFCFLITIIYKYIDIKQCLLDYG